LTRVAKRAAAQRPLNPIKESVFDVEEDVRCDIVNRLLDYHADVDGGDEHKLTSIYWAARRGYGRLTKLLISRKANIHVARTISLVTPVHVATTGVVVQHLCEAKADLSKPTSLGSSALCNAALKGRLEVAQEMIRQRADIHQKRFDTRSSALTLATSAGYPRLVRVLVDAKAHLRCVNSALFDASYHGHSTIVQMLIEAKADVNTHARPQRPLIVACYKGDAEITNMLLDAGATDIAMGATVANQCGHKALASALHKRIRNQKQ